MNLDALQRTFDELHRDAPGGAGLAVIDRGRVVCERSAGEASPGVPWTARTMIGLASATKAMASATALLMVERGALDLDRPIASYWPAFGAHGKDRVTARELLAHRCGVVTTPVPFSPDEQYAHEPIVARLADATPDWEPGAAHGYHAVTFGWLISGLLQAAVGVTLFDLFEDEIVRPFGLDLTMRLTQEQQARVATSVVDTAGELEMADDGFADFNAAMQDPASLLHRATYGATTLTFDDINDPYVLRAPDPSGGGHGTALGLARLYAALVTGLDGRPALLSPGLVQQVCRPHSDGPDAVLRLHSRWGLGFQLPGGPMWPGEQPATFGHGGASGSLAFIDVERGLAFAYAPSAWMSFHQGTDERATRLVRDLLTA